MTLGRIFRIALFASLAVLLSAFLANSGSHPAAKAQPQPSSGSGNCVHVGGSIITNFDLQPASTKSRVAARRRRRDELGSVAQSDVTMPDVPAPAGRPQ